MSDQPFYKFPSTPHLLPPTNVLSRKDKILDENEAELFFKDIVTIEEKLDGANLGISFTADGILQLQNRGNMLIPPYFGQWKPLENWLIRHIDFLFDTLTDRYILFGEWCYATHSIFYDSLPDWFLAFDVYDKKNKVFLSAIQRNEIVELAKISKVPSLFKGYVSQENLEKFLQKSTYGNEICEGLYLRIDSNKKLLYRAKYVRKDFLQTNELHWRKKEMRTNILCSSVF